MNIKIVNNVKNSIFMSIGFVVLIAMTNVAAEQNVLTSNTAISPDQAKAIHQDLRDLRDKLEKAMNENDFETILANVDENVVFLAMNAEVVKGRENLGAYYKRMMQGPDRIIDSMTNAFVADDLSILLEDDIAIAQGHSDSSYDLTHGQTIDVNGIWSSTLVHRDGAWKIASFHYSVNMFDNPIVKAQNTLLWIVGAGGVLLALIAFLLGRRRKKV